MVHCPLPKYQIVFDSLFSRHFQPVFSAGVWHSAPQRHPLGPSNLARFASGTWANVSSESLNMSE